MIEKERGGLGVGKRVTRKQAAPPQHNYFNLSSNSSENVLHYIWALIISGWDASTVSAFQSLCSYCWISRSHWGCWYQQTLCGSGERTGWAERTTWGSWSSTHRTGRDSEGQLRLWEGWTQISIQRSAVCSSVWFIYMHVPGQTHTLYGITQRSLQNPYTTWPKVWRHPKKVCGWFPKFCSNSATFSALVTSNTDDGWKGQSSYLSILLTNS